MAATYGVVNLISSFGVAAHWRHLVVRNLPTTSSSSHIVDLMSGMGELCRSIVGQLPMPSHVTGVDISPEMIRRAKKDWPFPIEMVLADALQWDFLPGSADVVISSFGLKTFDLDQQALLAERVARLLRPGGAFSFLEISVPPIWFLRPLYMFYLERIIPLIGRLFLGNPANYRLLGVYTRAFGNCRHFAACLRHQGLRVSESSHLFGCATSVRGTKPC
jgi:demethylmenaquinone methyltransferase/2-methoxy-6-polyprenyl-1,4-benzoquinol methylase